jgi:hypothetical protein
MLRRAITVGALGLGIIGCGGGRGTTATASIPIDRSPGAYKPATQVDFVALCKGDHSTAWCVCALRILEVHTPDDQLHDANGLATAVVGAEYDPATARACMGK